MVQEEKVILAYASQYKEKYYFNDTLGKLPEAVSCRTWILFRWRGIY